MDQDLWNEAAKLIGSETIQTSSSLSTFGATADKDYDSLLKYWNVTSYSQLSLLHRCPREYRLAMERAVNSTRDPFALPNLDFVFGHAVGAGVQNYLLTGDLVTAGFNASMAWRAPFEERWDKKKKSLWEGLLALDIFAEWWKEAGEEWELLILDNGKPGIELNFSLHARNSFKHYGHIDIVLRNKITGILAVLEIKTNGLGAEEALYENSSQGVGYAVMLDAMFPGLTEYTVLYAVYLIKERRWVMMPFDKFTTAKAEYIKDLLLDHSTAAAYERIKFYPKRGESCFRFNKRCEFFGECNMVGDEDLPTLPAEREAERVDFVIDLEDVIKNLGG